jgi:hypothetical protein
VEVQSTTQQSQHACICLSVLRHTNIWITYSFILNSTRPLAFKKFNQTLNYVPNIESILIWKLCFENDGTINLVKGLSIVFFQTILEKICVDFSKYTLKFENIWSNIFQLKQLFTLNPPPSPLQTMLVQLVKWICNTCHLNTNIV